MSDVFVSYAHEDELEMERIRAPLSIAGHEVWIDREGIEPADRWRMSVEEAIERSDAFVFAISAHSLASDACLGELAHAEALNKKVIAICLQQSATDLAKPQILADLSWIMMRPEDDFEASVDRLIHALETDLEVVRTHTRILVRARAWETAGRRVSPLLRGEELVAAEEWLSRAGLGKGPQPTDLQREFIRASRRAAVRRQRTIASLSGLAAAIAIALSVFALVQRNDAIANQKLAQSRLLAAEAELALGSDPSLSTLLALRGLAVHHTGEAERALRDALGKLQAPVVLRGDTGAVTSAVFSPTGARALTASLDGSARIWDVRSGAQLSVLRPHAPAVPAPAMSAAAFSPDGSRVVTAGGNVLRVWDARTDIELWKSELAHPAGLISSVVFSPKGTRILVALGDGTARIYDARTGGPLLTIKATPVSHGFGIVYSAAFSPDDSRVLTADSDGTARVWEARTGALLLTLRIPHLKLPHGRSEMVSVTDAAFSHYGSRIVTASPVDIRTWNARTGALLAVLPAVSAGGMALSPDGSKIVTTVGGSLASWDEETGAELFEFEHVPGVMRSVAFSPDGSKIITAGSDATARIWDARAGSVLSALRGAPIAGAALSPDRTRVVVLHADGSARVLSERTGAELLKVRTGTPVAAGPSNVTFSPDGQRIVSAGGSGRVTVWEAHTGARLLSLPNTAFASVSLSGDGSKILTAGEAGTAHLWDARRGARLMSFGGPHADIQVGALSPNASELITAGFDGLGRIWNAHTGTQLLTLKGYLGTVKSVAFSPDGSRVLTTEEGGVRVWSALTGAPLLSLVGSGGSPNCAAFSPDGSRVVTASEDGTTRVWSAETGAPLLSLKLPVGSVFGAQFSNDGGEILVAGFNELRLYSTQLAGPIASLERIARGLVTRPFTPQERKSYLKGIVG